MDGRAVTAQLKYKKTKKDSFYVVRIRFGQKLILNGLKETTSRVEAGIEPARLAGTILRRLGNGDYMKLQVRGEGAAARAAVALSFLESFDNDKQFSFTSTFSSKIKGIEVCVAPS